MKKYSTYQKTICFILAIGFMFLTSFDFIFDISHHLIHVEDYLNGSIDVHSHKFDEISHDHSHSSLNKISNINKDLNNSNNSRISDKKVDHFKFVIHRNMETPQKTNDNGLTNSTNFIFKKIYLTHPSPPPKVKAA